MCIQNRPFRSALATLILTTGWALCDTACVSSNRRTAPAAQSVGFPAGLRPDPPSVSTSKPPDGTARVSVAATETSQAPNRVATNRVPSTVATGGEGGPTAASTPSESPSMIVTTTTHRSLDTQVAQASRRVWPFLVGVAIAVLAGLVLLIRPGIKAR
jgi:hypothetical protein